MPETIATMDEPLSPEQALHVNAVCDRFEGAWKAAGPEGLRPRIEDHLGDTPEPARSALLRHLVLLDIDYRRLRGEGPTPEDYQPRFPALSVRFLADALSPDAEKPAPAAKGEPRDGAEEVQTTVFTRSLAPAMRSDRYVVQQFHARGGIGEIWLAEDADIGRAVAVKRLRKKCEEQQDRFLAEAQITGQLEHPGIVPVHDLGLDADGRPFYVMTFIHGWTLKDAIDDYHSGKQDPKEAVEVRLGRLLEVFVKVCQAVAYAHSKGVIHRDLKPENIMLGEYGEVLVLDWGLAKVRDQPETAGSHSSVHLTYPSGSSETGAGTVLGSPAYMAPEVAEGRAADADERTDVYLLGATLYHLLTGRLPRQGSSRAELVDLARSVPPPPPRKLRADVPRALEAICLKAMAHRKADRYATALEVAADVQRYLAGAPVSAYREPVSVRIWRWCRRHRRALGRAAGAAAVAGLVLFGAVELGEARRREAEERQKGDQLRRRERARQDLAEFRRLSEERHFYSAFTTPAGEERLQYDSRRGEDAGKKALEIAERLDTDIENLGDEREAFQKEYYDLLLMLGERKRAEAQRRQVPAAHVAALDHFLAGERHRAQVSAPRRADGTDWQPNAEELGKAIAEYQEALRLEPQQYWCYYQIGRCYLSLGLGTEAVEALSTCVALRPDRPWGYSARGLTLGLIKRFGEGEADLERALALDPDFGPALLHRGILAWLQRKYDRALADFGKVLEAPEATRLVEAAYYRGQLRLERRQLDEARQDFDRVVKENAGFRPVYLSLAQVHFLRNDPEQGLADLRTFLDLARPGQLNPAGPEVFELRGRLLRHFVRRWDLSPEGTRATLKLAQESLSLALKRGGRSAELLDDLGAVLEFLGEPAKALAAYEQALKAEPPRQLKVKIRLRCGQLCAQFLNPPQYQRARDEYAEALRLGPGEGEAAEAHAGLGYVAALQGLAGEAQREAAQALHLRAGDYQILHWVACIYAQLSRHDPREAPRHQEFAMTLIYQALRFAQAQGAGDKELAEVLADDAFEPLKDRPEFKKLRGRQ